MYHTNKANNRDRSLNYKTNHSHDPDLRQHKTLQYKAKTEKARLTRSEIVDKKRNLPKLLSDNACSAMEDGITTTNSAIKQEAAVSITMQRLEEWRQKKALEKLQKVGQKKPFISGSRSTSIGKPALMKSYSDCTYSLHRSANNSIGSISSKSNTSTSSITSRPKLTKCVGFPSVKPPLGTTSRVTRSQAKQDDKSRIENTKDKSNSGKNFASNLEIHISENDFAWIPADKRTKFNFKVKKRSMGFSQMLNTANYRSPFVFGSQQPSVDVDVDDSNCSISGLAITKNLFDEFSSVEELSKPCVNDYVDLIVMDSPEVTIKNNETKLLLTPEVADDIIREGTNGDVTSTSLLIIPASTISENANTVTSEVESSLQSEEGASIDYYLNILNETTDEMLLQRDRWKATLHTLTEACDHIRSAIGHTELLVNKKFKQFNGLIADAKINPGQLELVTRCSDLQGFWDMMYREVENIHSKYSKLVKMAENGFEAVKSTHKPIKSKSQPRVSRAKKESTTRVRNTRSSSVSLLQEQIQKKRLQLKENPVTTSDIVIMGHVQNNTSTNEDDVMHNSN